MIRSLVATLAVSALVAGQDNSPPAAQPLPERFVDMAKLPGGRIRTAMQEWLAAREISPGMQPDGAFVAVWSRPVILDTASDQWGTARRTAFISLEQTLRAKFLEFLEADVAAETVANLLDDPQARERLMRTGPAGIAGELAAKTEALSVAKLDAELRELGVSDERIAELSAAQKHVELRDSIERTAKVRAIGRISGMRPLKTFEGEDADGNYSVGMIAVWSPRQQALAERILRGDTGTAGDGETVGIDIADLFVGEQGRIAGNAALCAAFADEVGVRLVTDADGRQGLIAFAQVAPLLRRNDSATRQQLAIQAAMTKAETDARVMIQEFLALTLETSTETKVGEVYEKYLLEHRDGRVDDVAETAEFTDWLQRRARSSAAGVQVGVQMLERWEGNHPLYGVPLVGVIAMWSPSSAELAELAARGGTPEQRGTTGAGVAPGVRGSRDFEGTKKNKPKW